jgi:succinoglycan biosynthesis transport protein ExoP
MDLRQYARVLFAHWLLIALCVVASVAVAAALAWMRSPTYASHVQFYVSANPNSGSVSDQYTAVFLAQQRASTYSQLITSSLVRQRVDARTQSGNAKIEASVPSGSAFVDVTVSDRSPTRARAVADALAAEFPDYIANLEQTSSGSSPVTVTVSRQAELPGSAVAPRKKFYLVLGAMVGLVLGLVAAILREAFDRRARDARDVSAATGKAVVGELSESRATGRNPLVMLANPSSERAEEFRRLRANLDFQLRQRASIGLVVTSVAELEGKSFVAANLAISFAQMGSPTVLVDADLVRSGLSRTLRVDGETVGLGDVLTGEAPVEGAVREWSEELPLGILPAGRHRANSPDLITPARVEALLGELSQHAEVVIFDTPAIGISTDAINLAQLPALGTVIVARSRAVRTQELRDAVELLDGVAAQVLGVVVNRLRVGSARLGHRNRLEKRYVAAERQAAAQRPLQVPAKSRRSTS